MRSTQNVDARSRKDGKMPATRRERDGEKKERWREECTVRDPFIAGKQ